MATSTETFRGARTEGGCVVVTVTVTTRLGSSWGTWECACGRSGADGTSRTHFRSTVDTVVLKQAAGAHVAVCDGTGEA
jgi:hypothetical protein